MSIALRRRGVLYARDAETARAAGDPESLWATGAPIHLPRALALGRHRSAIGRTLRSFDAWRVGASFREDVAHRLRRSRGFALRGSSVNSGDAREIEKAHADAPVARDLWAKLSWVATDARDRSLRVRFSFGPELPDAWGRDARLAVAADRFAEAAFPECTAITRDRALVARVERLAGAPVRFSERIVYSNAPGGGAALHHDAEKRQLGVVYGQLAGETAWVAAPNSLVRELTRGRPPKETPALIRALVARGALIRLRAGDALILPSPRPGVFAWHSVFALGERPSLSLSFGIFAGREPATSAGAS